MTSRGCHNLTEESPLWAAVFTYVNFIILYIFGVLRDFMRWTQIEKRQGTCEVNAKDFVPLHATFENFYSRNIYYRVRDCFARPVSGVPGVLMKLRERVTLDYNWSFKYTGQDHEVLNLGSYNYLGFAENEGPCTENVVRCLKQHGTAQCSSYAEVGYTKLHQRSEKRLAEFLGTEDAIIFGMGFASNSTNIPSLVGKGCLILSDESNHSSIVLGCRLSGATIRVFKHCDVNELTTKLKDAIVKGQYRTGRPWRKILIIVEGIYSMEGTISPLPEIIELKKKYRAYLFVDEAHSIGAIGSLGRGIVDYFNCNPRDVDVLMGTFTKSFGSCGGYIGSSKKVVDHIRRHSHAATYASSISPPLLQQVMNMIDVVDGKLMEGEGRKRLDQLAWNVQYFRKHLNDMNLIVYGDDNSPVVPVMLFATSKIAAFNREMLKRGIAVVTVGFPATPLTLSRVRFCLSSGHTKEMLDQVLTAVSEVADMLCLKISRRKKFINGHDNLDTNDLSPMLAVDEKKRV